MRPWRSVESASALSAKLSKTLPRADLGRLLRIGPMRKGHQSAGFFLSVRATLHEQRAVLRHVFVKTSYELGIAVVEQGRDALTATQYALSSLSPTGVVELGVHIGPEAVLCCLHFFPKTNRALVREGNTDDRLDRLEAILLMDSWCYLH